MNSFIKSFKHFINSGGGFIGIHAAADTEYDWPWYGKLVGAYFKNHPPGTSTATITTIDNSHVSTNHLPKVWEKKDEWSATLFFLLGIYTVGTGFGVQRLIWVNSKLMKFFFTFFPMPIFPAICGGDKPSRAKSSIRNSP